MPSTPSACEASRPSVDLIDADTGEVAIESGRKLTVRAARQLAEKGLKALRASDADLYGQYIAEDLYNPETGEIYAEAGEEITEKSLAPLLETGFKELPVLDIDHVNIGAYIRNTLKVDKNLRARTPCSTSTVSCARASRRRSKAPRRCSNRCSSTPSVTISRRSAG